MTYHGKIFLLPKHHFSLRERHNREPGPFSENGELRKNGGALCSIEPYCLPSGCFNQQAIVLWLMTNLSTNLVQACKSICIQKLRAFLQKVTPIVASPLAS